ncbi:MAG TPA: DUF1343 domain-containing protein [Puia sp.]|uniref:exo-beta-N-acetylmuramidase NamZ family protein n=1 Tax=Puia sp. TaxID=2045100 RepID=UPI002C8330A8|nr:DUF1343 domain-containing protein [Puia sp.]HVU98380.1 DUF1343 domain-containing protein [Puia sp.]
MDCSKSLLGVDLLLASPPAWCSSRIALVTNQAAVTSGFRPSRLALLEAGFRLVKLFSPEHGLSAMGPDGHLMRDTVDGLTGLPVISLYGDRLAPSWDDLSDVDLVLFDIPDIGSRFYTYLWTMTHVLEACAGFGRPLVIADRPNPLSGRLELAEGPMLDEGSCASFIGRWALPVRHSCTLGELAGFFNTSRGIGCDLEVVACSGWDRRAFFPAERSFVPLSPAIPSFESALLYPGLCLFEATNLSEGRGTATPFRVVGAPWMRAKEVVEEFNRRACGVVASGASAGRACGVVARAVEFEPGGGKYGGRWCPGVMLHVLSMVEFRPVETGCLLLAVIRDLHPGLFEWAPYPTHVNPRGVGHLDLLLGVRGAEALFESGAMDELAAIRKYTDTGDWAERVRSFLLYP